MSSQQEKEKKKNPHEGHRQRMRKRFLENRGFETFEDHEVLEVLLYYVNKTKNTNEMAHDLLKKCGSLDNVLNADASELMEVKGIGEEAAFFFRVLREFMKTVNGRTKCVEDLKKFDDRCEYYFRLLDKEADELFMLTCLDDSMRVIHTSVIARGTPGCVKPGKMDIVRKVANTHCNMVMVAHNHPTGPPMPSMDDIQATRMIDDVLRKIDVKLVDHIIVGDGRAISLIESGNYVP